MIRIVRVHGPQHADVVDVTTEVRQEFADRNSAFSARTEAVRRRKQAAGRPFRDQIGSLGSLAGVLCQCRFRIEQVRLKRASVHEQVDDAFRSRCEMAAGGSCPRCRIGETLLGQKRCRAEHSRYGRRLANQLAA